MHSTRKNPSRPAQRSICNVNVLKASITETIYFGDHAKLIVRLPGGQTLAVKSTIEQPAEIGENVYVSWATKDCLAFEKSSDDEIAPRSSEVATIGHARVGESVGNCRADHSTRKCASLQDRFKLNKVAIFLRMASSGSAPAGGSVCFSNHRQSMSCSTRSDLSSIALTAVRKCSFWSPRLKRSDVDLRVVRTCRIGFVICSCQSRTTSVHWRTYRSTG